MSQLQHSHGKTPSTAGVTRRGFAKSAALASGALILTNSKTAFGSDANSALRLGLIGCGGRGTHMAGVFVRNTNTQITALSDPFQDRIDGSAAHLNRRLEEMDRSEIDSSRMYAGLKSYEELLALDEVDTVLITSPVYYHPDHLEAAVDAGKHVYCEKPVASDVAGCQQVIRTGEKAEGKVSVMIGFQIRKSQGYIELAERIHNGDIGDPVAGLAWFHTGALGLRSREGASESENRLRNWVFDIALSGDIIVEQNCHIIDVVNWQLNSYPERAFGTGGQRVRTYGGDCYDHFIITYWYPNDVKIDFSSTQFLRGWGDCRVRLFGDKGTTSIEYGDNATVTGENAWRSEVSGNLSGTEEAKIRALAESIFSGNYVNEAKDGAMSTLACILGRTAAYEERMVTWDEMIASNHKFEVDLDI